MKKKRLNNRIDYTIDHANSHHLKLNKMNVWMNMVAHFLGIVMLTLNISCSNHNKTYRCPMKCEGEKTYTKNIPCTVCNMNLELVNDDKNRANDHSETYHLTDHSLYNFEVTWHNQNNQPIELSSFKNTLVVVTMIYTSCQAACPRLTADMRQIAAQFNKKQLGEINFVLISIDPENDSPENLLHFANEHQLNMNYFTLLNGHEENVRIMANLLAVKYNNISPIDFSHSNIISLLNRNGELIYQQEGLGVDNRDMVEHIKTLLN